MTAVFLLGFIPPEAPVADAVMRGADVAALQALVDGGADVNAAQGDGMTALHWAARTGTADVVRFLLEAGAQVTAETRLGSYTPLHMASEAGHGALVSLLLERGSDPNQPTASGGATPLHLAAGVGNVDGVAALVEHGATVDAREAARGQTPLMFAAAAGRTEVVRRLLASGADATVTTGVIDVPAITLANQEARQVRDSVLTAFREAAGAQDDLSWRPTPAQLQEAARTAWDHRQSVDVSFKEVAAEGDDILGRWPDRVRTWGGLTALLYAVREGHDDTAMALLDGGAPIDQVSAGDQTSPLLMATIHGYYDLAMRLLDRGADPNVRNIHGDQPLFATVETRWAPRTFYPSQHHWMDQETTHIGLMEALLEAGADPDARLAQRVWYAELNRSDLGINFVGATPFFRAAHALDLEAMRLLVAHGADPSIPTRNPDDWFQGGGNRSGFDRENDQSGLPPVELGGPGAYAVHAVAGVGHGQAAAGNSHRHVPDGWMPALRYVVEELGADVNLRDHGGYAPVHHAAARGDNEMIMYLVEKGADVTFVSRRGHTTADMANSPFITVRPFPSTIELLESLGSHNNNVCLACGDAEKGGGSR